MATLLVQQGKGFKTASTAEPGGLNEKRRKEVNSVCTAGQRGGGRISQAGCSKSGHGERSDASASSASCADAAVQ